MAVLEHKTAENLRLQKIVDDAGEAGLFLFPQLSDEDCCIFGRYIQIYNYIEMNLRRSIEVFCRAGLLSSPNNYQLLQAAQLVPKLIEAVNNSSLADKGEIIKNLEEIELRRDFRHIMAHWAGRRFPNDDAVIFFTKRARRLIKFQDKLSQMIVLLLLL